MSRFSVSPDQLFERPWRAGHPFRPRCGRLRRWSMILLLLLFCLIIGGYRYITDSGRVRMMAETYLSQLVGGRVEVGQATLSVFEGLRLEDVKVHVDDDVAAPDSVIFSARTFVIHYDPRVMLGGQLEAMQIVVEKPRVHLTANVRNGTWNFYRLGRHSRSRPRPTPSAPKRAIPLPEILLRNAQVEVNELRGTHRSVLGSMAIDGQISPAADGEHYAFELQSRGTEGVGPLVSGTVAPGSGEVDAQLRNFEFGGDFEFGRDVQSMLPEAVREWWERHNISGRLDIPVLHYSPARQNRRAAFKVESNLNGVTLVVRPEEWMTAVEVRRAEDAVNCVQSLAPLYGAAGYGRVAHAPEATPAPDSGEVEGHIELNEPPAETVSESGDDNDNGELPKDMKPGSPFPPRSADSATASLPPTPIDNLVSLIRGSPITLRQVAGTLVFTEAGIDARDLSGRVENNGVRISGRILGYRPDSPVSLRLASLESEDIYIPPSPRWANSLPKQIREAYEQMRPTGTCRFEVQADRVKSGGRVRAGGHIDIVNGQFTFEKFPYPLREASGRVAFGHEGENGPDWIRIINMRARGPVGGANQDNYLNVDGRIGPIDPSLPDPGVDVHVSGKGINSEETLTRSFPPEVRQALRIFDNPQDPLSPYYRGDFSCHVLRPEGNYQKWTFDTDLYLDDASGMLAAFPYPLRHLNGKVKVREGYVDIESVRVKQEDATLTLDGRVVWDEKDARVALNLPPASPGNVEAASANQVRTRLQLGVRGLPADQQLVAAIPADRREWLRKLGFNGRLDIDGIVTQPLQSANPSIPPKDLPFDWKFAIALKGGSLTPEGSRYTIGDVGGKLLLGSDRMHIEELHGTRGQTVLAMAGDVTWAGSRPYLALQVQAHELAMESALYELLPAAGKRSWDSMRPEGTIDADVSYVGPVDAVGKSATRPAVTSSRLPSQGAVATAKLVAEDLEPLKTTLPLGFHAAIRPHRLSIMPVAMPYKFEGCKGTITVNDDKVVLDNLSANHGDGRFTVSGTGSVDERPVWDVKLGGDSVRVDKAFRDSLPASLQTLIDALSLKGVTSFHFSRLVFREGAGSPEAKGAAEPEIDLTATLELKSGSLDVGVPLQEVNGEIRLDAELREGRLTKVRGDIDVSSLVMAGRTLRNFHAELSRVADRNELQLTRMRAELAGGAMAGRMSVLFPDDGPSRYTLDLVLRNADVRDLAREANRDIRGSLTASLSLEGNWADPNARRGRGDVTVEGKEMYHIPLVLGLLQVTNLALPIAEPFHHGIARYSLEGQRVAFEKIELRSDTMVMSGTGHLDFGTKQVRLSMVTDNPGGLNVPFLRELWQGARNELMKINVKGTIEQPQVETSVMGTFTTTIDEVFRGDSKK